ncbi:VPS35 endosomal protein-sorting factor-like [Hydractinia symbiolongicarpus]|uniref:VPS35 endosomal protein-sorting factor-like n=1 Tax=Hydractinia symbiolongicarpus TaxID=13093 RepID=UPI00254D61E7|nr:VPS35 endosomal protein-sorting factor-like [Hydractinia symbiolongicarpus]XP_057310900.1 VPS35 endosomal protein-sorting factor-like [Hydractinia symbiolongicarpus]
MGTVERADWVFRKRDYELERKKFRSNYAETSEHPLRGTVVKNVSGTNIRSSTSEKLEKQTPSDPLSLFASPEGLDGTDPLSLLARGEDVPSFGRKKKGSVDSGKKFGDTEGYIDSTFEPWSTKRSGILSKYTTSEKLSISTSFLSGSDREKLVVKQQTSTTDKLKTRLEQLDDFEEGSIQEMLNLSQTEYVNRIEELNSTLLSAWGLDQRVKALKIGIQCSKLLGDTAVLQFYPSKFVLITDILDNFGKLVFERIHGKSVTYTAGSNTPRPLPENFTPEEVPESAKETCRNWFYKVASIRELIPRLYVEMAILKCYSFLTTGEYSQALMRLTHQIRGIADPLVAVYARAYLCRVGIIVAPQFKDHLKPCWFDYLSSYKQLKEGVVQNKLAAQGLSMPTYLQLFPPALDWLLQCIAYKASDTALTEILTKCNTCNSALILNSVMSAFDPKYIASRAMEFSNLIKDTEDSGFPKYLLYRSLGTSLAMEDPPDDIKLTILNEVWKVVTKLKEPSEYISCAEVWIEYPVKNFTCHEVNTLLGNIVKHITPDRAFENFYPQLLSILTKVVSKDEFSNVLAMDNFLPFFDMFQKESVKVEASRTIMEAYNRTAKELSDPVLINSLFSICKTMHDSVSAITLDDDRRVMGNLISGFLRTVSFGRDFERQLTFYVEARAMFSNLDVVLVMLVQSVNLLTMNTKFIVKCNHTRKTAAFVRACMAYSFITIPSMTDIFTRLKLYLLCGQTALANQAIGQADAFFRAAINLLPDVPKTIELDNKARASQQYFVEYINSLLSTLLIVPDHPDHEVLYLFRGLLNVLQDYAWDDSTDAKTRVYLNAVCVLSAACQELYIYQVYKVDSNDKLYGSGQKFINEITSMIETIVKEIFEQLKDMGNKNLKKQSFLATAFFNRILSHGRLSSPTMVKLAQNLWRLATQHGQADKELLARFKMTIEARSSNDIGYRDLLRFINALVQPS